MEAFCKSCNRVTWGHPHIGIGSFMMTILTLGFGLLVILGYKNRCHICGCEMENTAVPENQKAEAKEKGSVFHRMFTVDE
jgi:hypothetical protein